MLKYPRQAVQLGNLNPEYEIGGPARSRGAQASILNAGSILKSRGIMSVNWSKDIDQTPTAAKDHVPTSFT
jgi:hypothetical protein